MVKVKLDIQNVVEWKQADVLQWASSNEAISSRYVVECLRKEGIDGTVLLALNEEDIRDLRYRLNYQITLGELKKLWLAVLQLQTSVRPRVAVAAAPPVHSAAAAQIYLPPVIDAVSRVFGSNSASCSCPPPLGAECSSLYSNCGAYSSPARCIPPEYFKTAISIGYSFLVTWITSFVMVIVHERVPDMKRYPPLPDIFLDNVPHIPWAFNMCEITGTLLGLIWITVIVFHKYRTVLLRRFFALAGTVFLLRCVTMLITSLSVPGTHLQCNQKDYAIDDAAIGFVDALEMRIIRAYTIWSGLGMSIQGVRTCGDYMFSGHTVALTLLNFFITEYTPRNLYFLHTLTWLLNMFGIFFILAAHEHYSIDVFVAFYITSRLFLYYHTLANNQALMQRDSTRTRIWFPMFSYFESSVDGIIPNEYDTFTIILENFLDYLMTLKDSIMMTAHRYWVEPPSVSKSSHQFSTRQATPSDVTFQQRTPAPSTYFSLKAQNISQDSIVPVSSSLNGQDGTIELSSCSSRPADFQLSKDLGFLSSKNASTHSTPETLAQRTTTVGTEKQSTTTNSINNVMSSEPANSVDTLKSDSKKDI